MSIKEIIPYQTDILPAGNLLNTRSSCSLKKTLRWSHQRCKAMTAHLMFYAPSLTRTGQISGTFTYKPPLAVRIGEATWPKARSPSALQLVNGRRCSCTFAAPRGVSGARDSAGSAGGRREASGFASQGNSVLVRSASGEELSTWNNMYFKVLLYRKMYI